MSESVEFLVSRKRILGIAAYSVIFFLWFLAAIYALQVNPSPAQQGAWVAYLITAGVPLGMFALCIVYSLNLPRIVRIDGFSIRTEGPLGVKEMAWNEVSGCNLEGTDTAGITLVNHQGRKLSVEVGAFEDRTSLRDAIRSKIPAPDPKLPLHAQSPGAKTMLYLTGGILGFCVVAILATGIRTPAFLFDVGLMAVILLPLTAYSVTYRVSLIDGVLRTQSCFGSKQVVLSPVVQLKTEKWNGKGGPSERFLVTSEDGTQIALASRLPNYPAFRTLISAAVGKPDDE